MEIYCHRQGKRMDDVRFYYDGVRIEEAQTPAQLDMEDGDVRSSMEPLTLYFDRHHRLFARACVRSST